MSGYWTKVSESGMPGRVNVVVHHRRRCEVRHAEWKEWMGQGGWTACHRIRRAVAQWDVRGADVTPSGRHHHRDGLWAGV